MPPSNSRRSFMSAVASLAGVVAIPVSARDAAAQRASTSMPNWDLGWFDGLRGMHKQLYDLGSFNVGTDPAPLRFARNFLDTFRDAYRLEPPNVNTLVGVSGPAFAINASDRLWDKYRLGERFTIVDPATKQPAVRNVLLDDPNIGVKALQARGTIFWQCNIALGRMAQRLAADAKMPVDEVRADLLAGLNPGVRLVPSHVMALALAQEHGFSYMKP
jgi:intracellular sulfur oxidation DsrE/DsrF family protein